MLCYSAEENQQEYCHISNVDDQKATLWSVNHWFIIPYECLEVVTVLHYILEVLAYFPYEKVVESRHNMLLKALTMHVSCLFFKPEAVSKHSVSLWIGYSEAEGNITSRGFPGTDGQTFWYISREAMK